MKSFRCRKCSVGNKKGTEFVFPGEQRDVKASMMVFSYVDNTDRGQGCLVATVPQKPGRVRMPSGCGREEVAPGWKWSGQSDRKDMRAGLGSCLAAWASLHPDWLQAFVVPAALGL